jgi:hypothetical protein
MGALPTLGTLLLGCQTNPDIETSLPEATSKLIAGGTPQAQLIAETAEPAAEHCIQSEINAIADAHEKFEEAFECGDELFATVFNELDGVGARVGQGQRFTRVPRADLNGTGEWATHTPQRATGPNAQACADCHRQPVEDGAGPIGNNVIRDPLHSGNPGQFIQRNTPQTLMLGALQRLAE